MHFVFTISSQINSQGVKSRECRDQKLYLITQSVTSAVGDNRLAPLGPLLVNTFLSPSVM